MKAAFRGMRTQILLALLLGLITCAVYWPVLNSKFVNFDDDTYVTSNGYVTSGLSRTNIAWAFQSFHGANWHPLTWLSHMTDTKFFGVSPRYHHLTNLLLHITNVLLLFFLLMYLTGNTGRAGLVAALFAVHPLHVESVAWVAERKDVLSALFWLLTIWAYAGYARRGGVQRYALVVVAFALGLMAKPMLVTLPLVLLLLDIWPLRRLALTGRTGKPVGISRLILEKVPLCLLAGASCAVTFYAQRGGGAMASLQALPLSDRIANAAVVYWVYILKIAWPTGLAPFYPYSSHVLLSWQAAAAVAGMVGVSLLAVRYLCRPEFIVGWFWFVISLVPVIGLVQVGNQGWADRYTYLPSIGLFIMAAWGLPDVVARLTRYRSLPLAPAAVIVVAALAVMCSAQVKHWHDSESLWRHTIAVTECNHIGYVNLGNAIMGTRPKEAMGYFEEALRTCPIDELAWQNLGRLNTKRGDLERAAECYRKAVESNPAYPCGHVGLGDVMRKRGMLNEAQAEYEYAIRLDPDFAEPHSCLGAVALQRGNYDVAISHFREALKLQPVLTSALFGMGIALELRGETAQAVEFYVSTLRVDTHHADAANNLAWIYATHQNCLEPTEAIRLAQIACRDSSYGNPPRLDTLAAAYAAAQRFDKAVETIQAAICLASPKDYPGLALDLQRRLKIYRSHSPYFE